MDDRVGIMILWPKKVIFIFSKWNKKTKKYWYVPLWPQGLGQQCEQI